MSSPSASRLVKAYLAGVGINGCEVHNVKNYLRQWLHGLGYVEGSKAVIPASYCRYRPATVVEHLYFIKGAFETYGEFFMGDPHGGYPIVVFETGSKKLVKSLRLIGVRPLVTTDETRRRRFVVIYDRRDIKLFVKMVKPVVDDPHVAVALGLCKRI
ncbi:MULTISPECIES: hypothetical protein [Pyrobaculum]|uniref:DOD-type homing endonuclease domain-containing protein n=2 Tax=Pyrobaculum arsenaticum TaxID=121277 RepID=A4WL43_PYRAR|nr:hypothetical protein [Pyrobaculum arsenaticum]ABP51110.1 conserved hypothetical protein [Pyrobaculum arsenaticum DSM 13514]MCY0891653.1 hypothetical protein [Pyrobaculum arsenaticum]NYR15166.1 hypothetical protein [Pyrobaculum arsenaticum]